LVSPGEYGRRQLDAKSLSGFEVEHGFVLRRRLHRKVGRFLTFEDAIDVAGRAAVRVDEIRTVRDETAARDIVTERVERRRPVPGGSGTGGDGGRRTCWGGR